MKPPCGRVDAVYFSFTVRTLSDHVVISEKAANALGLFGGVGAMSCKATHALSGVFIELGVLRENTGGAAVVWS